MKLAFFPGLGGGESSLAEIAPALAERGIESTVVSPRYGERSSWDLDDLADEVVATGADVYAGHSWGAAIAARAALKRPCSALVLLDGAFVSPSELPRLGSKPTIEERIADIREEHAGYRWPNEQAYLDYSRSASPRWNETIEQMALEGMRYDGVEVLPPFDADELELIIRGYETFDAPATLSALPVETRVLLVVATPQPDHAVARADLLERFQELVPQAEVRHVDSPHDVIWGLGPALGGLIAGWLLMEVPA